ncbi:hypothetical protein LZ31DRAFT_281898 [Colletotrichum somersetense]|nr:hypothetical protein LZ31DRAFT_281898 [Colletotrichum somersetense]
MRRAGCATRIGIVPPRLTSQVLQGAKTRDSKTYRTLVLLRTFSLFVLYSVPTIFLLFFIFPSSPPNRNRTPRRIRHALGACQACNPPPSLGANV